MNLQEHCCEILISRAERILVDCLLAGFHLNPANRQSTEKVRPPNNLRMNLLHFLKYLYLTNNFNLITTKFYTFNLNVTFSKLFS